MERSDNLITLNEDEVRVVGAIAKARGMSHDEAKTKYSVSELIDYGFIRENWSFDELREKRFDNNGIITSFDGNSNRAKSELLIDVPFAEGVQNGNCRFPCQVLELL